MKQAAASLRELIDRAHGLQQQASMPAAGVSIADELVKLAELRVVYRARNLVLDQERAIKVIAGNLSDDGAFRERFRRESRLAA